MHWLVLRYLNCPHLKHFVLFLWIIAKKNSSNHMLMDWAILIGWLFVCEKQGWHDTLGTVQQDWAQHWGHEVATDSVDSPSTHKSRIFMDRIWGWCTWFVGRWCFELGCIDTELYFTGTKHFIYWDISLQQLYTINNLLSSTCNRN